MKSPTRRFKLCSRGKEGNLEKNTKNKALGNQFNLKAEEVIQSIKRIGDCHKNKVQSKFISLGSPIFLMSRRCELTDTPDTPLLVFKRGSMPRLNMLTLYCDSDNCDFQTPPLNREHYQAMVAHLQVIKDIMGKSPFFARILFEPVLPDSRCADTRSFPTFSFCREPESLRL